MCLSVFKAIGAEGNKLTWHCPELVKAVPITVPEAWPRKLLWVVQLGGIAGTLWLLVTEELGPFVNEELQTSAISKSGILTNSYSLLLLLYTEKKNAADLDCICFSCRYSLSAW